MQLRGRLIAVGIVALIIGLLTAFPARIAYQWFAPPGVSLESISGSVWSGHVAQAEIEGLYLQDLSWRFKPLGVFSGNLAYAIEATPVSGFINATVLLGVTGTIRDCIRDKDRLDEIFDLIEEGRSQYGSQSFDQHLMDLVKADQVDFKVAKAAAKRVRTSARCAKNSS